MLWPYTASVGSQPLSVSLSSTDKWTLFVNKPEDDEEENMINLASFSGRGVNITRSDLRSSFVSRFSG